VREEIAEYLSSQGKFREMFDEYINTRKALQDSQEHEKFICDICECDPIKGIRYMCSVCPNFDLCSVCEAKGAHSEHALLKIRKPSQAPAKLICQYLN